MTWHLRKAQRTRCAPIFFFAYCSHYNPHLILANSCCVKFKVKVKSGPWSGFKQNPDCKKVSAKSR